MILAFLLYYGATAFGTTGGRAQLFGLYQSLISRYMTSSLITWSLVFILYFNYFKDNKKVIKVLIVLVMIISLVLTLRQGKVFKYDEKRIFEDKVAALALELKIKDDEYIKKVFPYVDWITEIAEEPMKRDLSIFSNSDIKDKRELLGKIVSPKETDPQKLDKIEIIDKTQVDKEYMRFSGYIKLEDFQSSSFVIVDNKNKIIGYALCKSLADKLYFVTYSKIKKTHNIYILYKNTKIPIKAF